MWNEDTEQQACGMSEQVCEGMRRPWDGIRMTRQEQTRASACEFTSIPASSCTERCTECCTECCTERCTESCTEHQSKNNVTEWKRYR